MATRLKTIEFAAPVLSSASDAVVTNFTQITVYIPEGGGTVTFRSVVCVVTTNDIITATGGTVTEYRTGLRLGAAGYTTVTNLNDITNSAENISHQVSADFTSHFTTNWTGTSMTCDIQTYWDQSTGTTLGMRDLTARLYITYEYDDTQSTHIKTVYLPLDAPSGALATSKPGSATATIPALDTWLPEDSVTIRDWFIVIQGNSDTAGTDPTVSMEIDTNGVNTTGGIESGLATDRWFTYIWRQPTFTTGSTHSFYIWGSAAHTEHLQIYMVITYEFDVSATTTILNSLLLPMEIDSPMGGTTSSDYQRGSRSLWIAEPTTITGTNSGALVFFDKAAAISGLNFRVGTGAFQAYTDGAAIMGGGAGFMEAFTPTLARGSNTLQCDIYRTDTTDLGFNVSVLWIVNYTSGVAADGVGAHNHTVRWNLKNFSTVAAAAQSVISATAPVIPEANYFFTSIGGHYFYLSNTTSTPSGLTVQTERLSGESGIAWENCYTDISYTDPEVGIRQAFFTARSVFRRWPGDTLGSRIDIETSRRWRIVTANNSTTFDHLDLLLTYHSITFSVSGTISGSGGGTVDIDIFRVADDERVGSTSRVGNGAYSLTWYDDTADMYAVAYEDGTHMGRSDDGTAS